MSEKIKRANETLKKELSLIMRKEIDLAPGVLLTVTEVEISDDLIDAKVFVSIFPENKKNEVFSILKREIYGLQQILNKRMRMRWVPKIRFLEDKKLDEAIKIDILIEGLKNKEN